MRSQAHVRSGLIEVGVLSLVLASCAIPTPQEASDAVLTLRQYEGWAWAVGIALIWADLVLPIPQTAVIAALGMNAIPGKVVKSMGPQGYESRARTLMPWRVPCSDKRR